eukprot:360252-Chlamydomonas_euryale.AAC.11
MQGKCHRALLAFTQTQSRICEKVQHYHRTKTCNLPAARSARQLRCKTAGAPLLSASGHCRAPHTHDGAARVCPARAQTVRGAPCAARCAPRMSCAACRSYGGVNCALHAVRHRSMHVSCSACRAPHVVLCMCRALHVSCSACRASHAVHRMPCSACHAARSMQPARCAMPAHCCWARTSPAALTAILAG